MCPAATRRLWSLDEKGWSQIPIVKNRMPGNWADDNSEEYEGLLHYECAYYLEDFIADAMYM